jgi:hypothetical protein
MDEHGICVSMKPIQTYWYLMYYMRPDILKPKFHEKFFKCFGMPNAQYLELLEEMEVSSHFVCWKTGNQDAAGVDVFPLPLLQLGVLRYLGRGWTFNCIEEATAIKEEIKEETHRHFFTNSWSMEVLFYLVDTSLRLLWLNKLRLTCMK